MASLAASPLKVCILGNSNTGKSMMIECLKQGGNKVPENAFPVLSLRADIYLYKVKTRGKNISLKIWDTAGQEKHESIAQSYLRGARVVILVYDITNHKSYLSITDWFLLAKKCVRSNPIFILVGNKVDLHEDRKVEQSTAHAFARSHEWDYFETSALQGQNILFLFDQIAKDLVRPNVAVVKHINDVSDEDDVINETDTIILVDSSPKEIKKSKCGCQKRN